MNEAMKEMFAVMAVFLMVGCQKAELVEKPDREARSVQTEETDSVTVKPEIDMNGWEGSVDVGFNF